MTEFDTVLDTLDRRFTSGNETPVESTRITKEEYDVICAKLEEQNMIISGLEGYLKSCE